MGLVAHRRERVLCSIRPRVVIVDDDPSVCRALKRLVRSYGMDADTFDSGEAFIAGLQAQPSLSPDCVILDMQMPGLNGLEVQARLRASGRAMPIVFITANGPPQLREQAFAGGAVAFLNKPFDESLFHRTLQAVVEHPGQPQNDSEY